MQSSTDDLYKYINKLAQDLPYLDPSCFVITILMEINIRQQGDGFRYLQTAILLQNEHPELLITKGIYPAVAELCGSLASDKAVEHSIRNVLKASWKQHSKMWDVLYPSDKCPSNGNFIARMALVVELWKGCCKAYQEKCKEVASHEA